MGRLIDVDEYEKRIKPYDTEDVIDKALYNFAHDHLVTTPTAQPQTVIDQLRWERDIAVKQLHDLGYEFGEAVKEAHPQRCEDCINFSKTRLLIPQPEQRWIPVKTRPMTEEERQYWEEHTGVELEVEDAVFFDCQMPDDGQEVWVCYKSGTVSEDVCERDDFCGLEGNGDWLDIVAWMPRIKPEPWKGET